MLRGSSSIIFDFEQGKGAEMVTSFYIGGFWVLCKHLTAICDGGEVQCKTEASLTIYIPLIIKGEKHKHQITLFNVSHRFFFLAVFSQLMLVIKNFWFNLDSNVCFMAPTTSPNYYKS